MHLEIPRFRAWREADGAAQAAEHDLRILLVRSRSQFDTASVMDAAARARALRAKAHALFDDAMSEMRDLAESHHYRRVLDGGSPVQSQACVATAVADDAAREVLTDQRCGKIAST